jgi:hypothetical protein
MPPLITQGLAVAGINPYVRVFSQPFATIDNISCVFWLGVALPAPSSAAVCPRHDYTAT